MTPERQLALPNAPLTVENASGEPRFGTYQGSVEEVDLSRLNGRYRLGLPMRLVKHKRWLYTFVATPEVIALCAVADLSYTSNAFALVADLKQKKVIVDRGFLGLPGPLVTVGNRPGVGMVAKFRTLGGNFSAVRKEGDERYHLSVELSRLLPPRTELDWKGDLLAVGGPPPLTVIAPVSEGGSVDGLINVTQKWAGLLSFGTLSAGGRSYVLDGGVGGMDYTHGYLARHTAWRWAFACGRLDDGTPIGLNLVEGFNESSAEVNENALWIGKDLYPLGRARFTYNKNDVLDEWILKTTDGAVDLKFRPIGAHRELRDYKVVKSYFMQPVGLFQGTVKAGGRVHSISNVPGVTEDQDILW
jgi:hypothetical protein